MLEASSDDRLNVATRNIASAFELLARHRYRPGLTHCGGQGHRKLIFELWTGAVWLAYRPRPASPERRVTR